MGMFVTQIWLVFMRNVCWMNMKIWWCCKIMFAGCSQDFLCLELPLREARSSVIRMPEFPTMNVWVRLSFVMRLVLC